MRPQPGLGCRAILRRGGKTNVMCRKDVGGLRVDGMTTERKPEKMRRRRVVSMTTRDCAKYPAAKDLRNRLAARARELRREGRNGRLAVYTTEPPKGWHLDSVGIVAPPEAERYLYEDASTDQPNIAFHPTADPDEAGRWDDAVYGQQTARRVKLTITDTWTGEQKSIHKTLESQWPSWNLKRKADRGFSR